MSVRLANKRALVTAAAQGIGRAVAHAFLREGAEVVAVDINSDGLAKLREECGSSLHTAVLDVTDQQAIDALAKRERFNVVFNCAGIVHAGSILETERAQLENAWRVNVESMYLLCKALLPSMIAGGGGSIINMSSVASSIKAVPNRFAYSTTKAAVIGLTKSIATDFIHAGVRCNAICPGTVETPSLMQRIATQAQAQGKAIEEVHAQFKGRQPMGRLGSADEIAALAVYLASDESAFTTGAIHVIDGGWTN